MKKLIINPWICTGCKACEIACSFAHEKKFNPRLARIRVTKMEEVGIDYPITCRQCRDAPCVASCPVNALTMSNEKTILVDEEKCIRCGMCAEACPFGAITLHPKDGLPLICDLCGGNPACVKRCAVKAITYKDVDVAIQLKRDALVKVYSKPILKAWGIASSP